MFARWSVFTTAAVYAAAGWLLGGCSSNHDHDHSTHKHGDDHAAHKHGDKDAVDKEPSAKDKENIDKLAEAERKPALAQRLCPVSGDPLGSMGVPRKVTVKDKTFFLCCKGCESELKQDPDKVLKKLAEIMSTKSGS